MDLSLIVMIKFLGEDRSSVCYAVFSQFCCRLFFAKVHQAADCLPVFLNSFRSLGGFYILEAMGISCFDEASKKATSNIIFLE